MQFLRSTLSHHHQKTTTAASRSFLAPLSQAGISAATTTMHMPRMMQPTLEIFTEEFSTEAPPVPEKTVCELRFPKEVKRPVVLTAVPGPAALAFKETLGKYTCNLNTHFPVDLRASHGNYVADTDGNKFLDVFCSICTNAVGYNHPQMLEAAGEELIQLALATRTAIGVNPPAEYIQIVNDAFMSVAPPGMTRVNGSNCGSCANEGAFKVAIMNYAQKKRGGPVELPTQLELTSCLKNQSPGSPDYAILSFDKGFHGRLFGSLSTTRTKAMHKVDVPAFDWPAARIPLYQYPLEEHIEYNREQDKASLADVRAKISQWKNEKGSEVAAVVCEPIQGDGGGNMLSPEFGRGLQAICKEHGIYLILDEVQTGVCGTGKFWAHEHWDLPSPPDFVTFAKKMLSCGFYHNHDTRMETPYRHFNTFFGDPVRAQLTAAQNKIIKEDRLEEVAMKTGVHLQGRLRELEKKHPKFVQKTRGLATFLSFSCEDQPTRDALLLKLKSHGVNQGGCGDRSARFRPTLYFEEKHADIYADALDRACQDLS